MREEPGPDVDDEVMRERLIRNGLSKANSRRDGVG